MASIRWDFSRRRLSVKQKTNQPLICDTVCEIIWRARAERHRKHEDVTVMINSLALFGLKKASLYEVGYCLQREKCDKTLLLAKKYAINSHHLSRALKVTACSLFYLIAVLKQHSCSWELVDGVKIEGTRGSVVRSLWDFLKDKKNKKASWRMSR